MAASPIFSVTLRASSTTPPSPPSAVCWYLLLPAGLPGGKQYPYDAPHLAYISSGYRAESKAGSLHDWWANGILIQLLSRHPVAISACQPSLFGNLSSLGNSVGPEASVSPSCYCNDPSDYLFIYFSFFPALFKVISLKSGREHEM